jgi:hypothetical protein
MWNQPPDSADESEVSELDSTTLVSYKSIPKSLDINLIL